MMLIEQTTVPVAALPVQILKDHLRLGTGFADEGMQDGLVESHLRAAIAAIDLQSIPPQHPANVRIRIKR
nr:hypothetical protein [Gemmobacter sp.]